jgi:PKHD-type hydroxylase
MNLKYYYWYFQSAIPPKICDDILEYGQTLEKQVALTGINDSYAVSMGLRKPTKEELKDVQKKRKSDVVWMSDNWIYREIHPFIHQANASAGWNFQWDFTEACQFTEYKEGQYYDWHCDSNEMPYDKPDDANKHGKTRKLSMTLCLTEPDEYDGGELEFAFHDMDGNKQPRICEEIRARGSVIVFPSFVWHRVKPVTRGVRNSLVCWNLGQPYV